MTAATLPLRTLPGDPPLRIVLKASARARRVTLRVSALDGRVTLTRPFAVSDAEALEFARAKVPWLRAQIARCVEPRQVAPGAVLPVLSVPHRIVEGAPGIFAGEVRVRAGRAAGPQVAGMLKALARDRIAAAAARHAGRVGRTPGRLSLRDTRSRWGSCSSRGDLMLSWRLIMAPEPVLDYVVAHEVAHLVRMDHSPAFWAVVARLCPDWRVHRGWLRQHGAALHAWRFEAPDRPGGGARG